MASNKRLPIQSMTGFGSATNQIEQGHLAIEIRCVNNRYLDFNFRAPETLRFVEPSVRDAVQKVINRGRCEVGVRWRETGGANQSLTIDSDALKNVASLAERTHQEFPNLQPMSINEVLRWPGVMHSNELSNEEWQIAIMQLVEKALDHVHSARIEEGERLKGFMLEKLDTIDTHTQAAAQRIPYVKAQFKARLEEKLTEVREQLDAERVEQEMVIFANRIDITEEIDRLASHQKAFKQALEKGGVIGRRLDFLLQEINREVNTLASKSVDAEQTNHAVEMKVLIEQIREQVQNIE